MANEIEQTEIENTDTLQHAELRIPLARLDMTSAQVSAALAVVEKIKTAALGHLEVDDDNADATEITYKLDGDTVVVDVIQVLD